MTTTTVSQEAVEVTQADREAVAEFHRQSFKTLFTTTDADIDAGINRSYELLCQAFARHRQQAERAFEERERKLREALETLEASLTRDMGAGYAGVALCQALKETPDAG